MAMALLRWRTPQEEDQDIFCGTLCLQDPTNLSHSAKLESQGRVIFGGYPFCRDSKKCHIWPREGGGPCRVGGGGSCSVCRQHWTKIEGTRTPRPTHPPRLRGFCTSTKKALGCIWILNPLTHSENTKQDLWPKPESVTNESCIGK